MLKCGQRCWAVPSMCAGAGWMFKVKKKQEWNQDNIRNERLLHMAKRGQVGKHRKTKVNRASSLRTLIAWGFVLNRRDLVGTECYILLSKVLLSWVDNICHIALSVESLQNSSEKYREVWDPFKKLRHKKEWGWSDLSKINKILHSK